MELLGLSLNESEYLKRVFAKVDEAWELLHKDDMVRAIDAYDCDDTQKHILKIQLMSPYPIKLPGQHRTALIAGQILDRIFSERIFKW